MIIIRLTSSWFYSVPERRLHTIAILNWATTTFSISVLIYVYFINRRCKISQLKTLLAILTMIKNNPSSFSCLANTLYLGKDPGTMLVSTFVSYHSAQHLSCTTVLNICLVSQCSTFVLYHSAQDLQFPLI
jgi:predicted Na+-dependent transporter